MAGTHGEQIGLMACLLSFLELKVKRLNNTMFAACLIQIKGKTLVPNKFYSHYTPDCVSLGVIFLPDNLNS